MDLTDMATMVIMETTTHTLIIKIIRIAIITTVVEPIAIIQIRKPTLTLVIQETPITIGGTERPTQILRITVEILQVRANGGTVVLLQQAEEIPVVVAIAAQVEQHLETQEEVQEEDK